MESYPSPPTYKFRPLTHHFDGGFGAIADAFYQAAVRLEGLAEQERFINSSLPIAYLYRHGVELYLKSLIVVLHRGLHVPFSPNPATDTPSVQIGEKWIPIKRVHSVGALHDHFARVTADHMDQLQAITTTDWTTIPKQLGDWVEVIEEFDQKSTFFRYPGAGDAVKADFKESSIAEIWSRMAPNDPPSKGFVEFNENDEIVGAFRMEPCHLEPIRNTLRRTASAPLCVSL
jgi:hypothetical protein